MLTERVTVIRNTINDHRTSPQIKAYNHALSVADFTLKHSWCAIIDIDEYVAIKPKADHTASIQSYIEWVEGKSFLPPDIIALNWVFAGFDRRTGSISTSLSSLPSRIQLSLGKNEHIKSIFRPRLFLASRSHYPLESPNCIVHAVSSEGGTYSNYHTSLEPGIGTSSIVKKAAIVHYHHRSFPEFIWKSSSCRPSLPRNTSEVIDLSRLTGYAGHYFTATEKTHESSSWINSVMDTSLFKGLYEKLESDPIIKSLTEESIDMMRDRASFVASTLLAENSKLSQELAILLKASIEQ